jgi:hypothetical protein
MSAGNNDCFGNVRLLARRDFYRRWGRRSAAVVVIAILAFGGFRGYQAWHKKHLSKQSRDFFGRGDYQSAVLVARHLLQLDPDNVEACRIMADTAELAGSREALTWRERIVRLEPHVPGNNIALVASALRFSQPNLARKILDLIPATERGSAKFHELAGAVAIAEKATAPG